MNTETLKPAYNIRIIGSSSAFPEWTDLESIFRSIQNGWALLWQHHAVFTGQISNGRVRWLEGQPELGDEHLVRLRAFNREVEYHFWRSGQSIKGRLRSDEKGDNIEYADTDMVVRGVVGKPLTILDEFAKGEISIRTRNYIGYHSETYQAGYVDSRFVEFVKN